MADGSNFVDNNTEATSRQDDDALYLGRLSGGTYTGRWMKTVNFISGFFNKNTDTLTDIKQPTGTKTTPVDADSVAMIDSEASNVIKRLTFTNLKAFLKTYFDTLYTAVGTALPLSGGSMTGAILGDQAIRAHRPGAVISASANLEAIAPNTFFDVNTSDGAITITVTDAAAAAFAVDTEFEFFIIEATSTLTFATSGAQSIMSKDGNLSLDAVGKACSLKYRGGNSWRLIGDLS